MKSIALTASLFLTAIAGINAQTVPVQYLEPKFNASNYDYFRFGNSSLNFGGLMLNKSSNIYGNGDDMCIYTHSNRDLNLRSGTGNIILHPDANTANQGKTGIGLTNPTSKLHINGDVRINDNFALYLRSGSDLNHGIKYYGNGISFAGYQPDGPIVFGFNGGALGATWSGERVVLAWDHNGKVGIGTTNLNCATCGDYNLFVTKGIRTEKVKVDIATGVWADYVFSDFYELKSLPEVEKFIKANKHLPGVPSATEVEADGVDLGNMNAKLLEKVEEMTLYVIQQQKEIDALKQTVKNMK
ncbi:MAG: hypothetical protein H6585_12155 [Flavobacteriales bacterium]|nr:hypothetical protein [Flavobacteriales bacterium]MCB9449083.1 hypothetical protein [Flavobacteriales bacterium]